MDKEKIEKLKTLISNIERDCDKGQELARATIDKEPGQRSQNIYWRNVRQDVRDMKAILSEED